VAAAVLGVATSIGVWLFNRAFNAIHDLTFNAISGWAMALIPMVGGILRWLSARRWVTLMATS
jgi:hypothetical protein